MLLEEVTQTHMVRTEGAEGISKTSMRVFVLVLINYARGILMK